MMKPALPTAIELFAARFGKIALSPRGVLAVWGIVLTILFVMRAFFFTGTDADDGEQLIYMQSWALGYGARNPPVFTWLIIMVQPIFGVTVAAVVFVKFALLACCFYLLYRSGVIVLEDRSLAALAALSPIALYYVSWDATFHYTHSIILALAICLTFHQLLLLDQRRDLRSYILFGLGLAFGLLSKYNYLLFLGALLIAVLAERDMRRVVLDCRMLLATAVALLLAAPHYYWLWQQRIWLSAIAKDRFNPGVPTAGLLNLAGVLETFSAALNFLLPLALLYLLFFPRAWGPAAHKNGPGARYRRVLDILLIGILALTLVGVVAFGAVRVRNHYMFLLILFPLLALARARAAGVGLRALNLFGTSLLIFAVVVPAGVVIKYAIDPLRSGKAYYHVPYATFADGIRAAGFSEGTIVGDWFGYPLAGNFRPYFPNARILNLLDWQIAQPQGASLSRLIPPPAPDARGQCLLIWTPTDDGARKQAVLKKAHRLLDVSLPPDTPEQRLTAELHHGNGRTLTIAYILLPEGRGNCR
jgi:4-amino-4-deoxy-L-arabinose transferase-like glycosyltransferase